MSDKPLDDPAYRAEVKKETGLDLMPGEKLWEREKPKKKRFSWRDGVKLEAVFEDPAEIVHVGGRWMNDVKVAVAPEQVERIRQGYVCIRCLEPQETPMPKECSAFWCRFPMRDEQLREYKERFQGDIQAGGSTTLREDFDRLEDESKRRKFERQKARGEKPVIHVPSWASIWDNKGDS